MHSKVNNGQYHGPQKRNSSSLLFNPEPFLCGCGNKPVIEKGHHPESGKDGYFVVQCGCGNQSIYAKERYKAILDWNIKPISQDSGSLVCPGLDLEGLNAYEALEIVNEEFSRIKMLMTDKDRPHLDAEQWRRLKARYSWCQMLVTVIKRRLKALNAQPQNIEITPASFYSRKR